MELLDKKEKIVIMFAIMSVMLFASLNQTIVATALPRIVSNLGGMDYFSWVFTSYMLTSAVTAILVGRLSDIYGRKRFILIGIILFMIGSFLNGISSSMNELIVYRAIQGLGGGMIISTAFTVVGDLFSPRERGRWQGIMGGVFGISSILGPALGGFIVDRYDWHWVFWVFLPFGFIAFLMIAKLFPNQKKKASEKIDYFGSLFLTLTIVPLLLAFTWAGTKYNWLSIEIAGLLILSSIQFCFFIFVEKKVESPILPLHLFKNSIFTLSNIASFFISAAMFGVIMYIPIFIQAVIGTSATGSGFVLMPLTLTMVISSAITGYLVTKTGRYKYKALLGLLIMFIGVYFMKDMNTDTTNGTVVKNMIIVGSGLGLCFSIFTLMIQNAVKHKFLGTATAASQLFRQLGATIGVSILGTLMTQRATEKANQIQSIEEKTSFIQLPKTMEEKLDEMKNVQTLLNPEKLAEIKLNMPLGTEFIFELVLNFARNIMSYSLSYIFFISSLMVLIAFILALFIKEIPLRTKNEEE